MSIVLFLLFGLVMGFAARALMPGKQSMGLIATAAVGCVGSLLGGLVTNLFTGAGIGNVAPAGIIGSLLGALVVLFAYVSFMRRRAGGGAHHPAAS